MAKQVCLLAALLLSGLSSAMPVTESVNDPRSLAERSTILPSEDLFYSVPANISAYAPGQIIGYRKPPAPIAAFSMDPVNLEASWQIHYRTTDNFGEATATVLTVLVPHNADLSKVLSYQVAEDAASVNCGPSYALQLESATGELLGTMATQAELLLIEAGLEQGWVVILPDHEGPVGAYLANLLSGHATLDGIRAALASTAFTGIQSSARVGLWGYSGGSLASAWAAELQPAYAPELATSIVGVALGGTVPNISNVITTIDRTPFAGLLPVGIMGISRQYPLVQQIVDTRILPQYRAKFARVRDNCFVNEMLDFLLDTHITAMVDDPSVFTSPAVMAILNENALGSHVPTIPLYVYKSRRDEVSPIADTDDLVSKYCAGGASVHYTRDLVSEHATLAVLGAPRALGWLINALDGNRQTGCKTRTTMSSMLDISTLTIVPKLLVNALLALLSGDVGPAFIG
ncbi:lipase 2 [Grosmannia clavigera kw1407]|uniref:Lipase 2 n=1 Tax=Grosmannia clavigera (strain kw1407 / UAMH 11150) TaxID=655863 RepID=F0X7N2_GROCL|nr:lipase 2 [Grosmannia clavigera kw1407]EFX06646.1 lipase 2 [Grosmannia clavigera kw1407]